MRRRVPPVAGDVTEVERKRTGDGAGDFEGAARDDADGLIGGEAEGEIDGLEVGSVVGDGAGEGDGVGAAEGVGVGGGVEGDAGEGEARDVVDVGILGGGSGEEEGVGGKGRGVSAGPVEGVAPEVGGSAGPGIGGGVAGWGEEESGSRGDREHQEFVFAGGREEGITTETTLRQHCCTPIVERPKRGGQFGGMPEDAHHLQQRKGARLVGWRVAREQKNCREGLALTIALQMQCC